jgi:beta-galactosidase
MKYRGVAYYPEYWPEARWAEDIRLMREARINLVRVGEFAWTAMEPREGDFTLDWLHRLVRAMGDAGIGVMLCTPTATPPAWLTDQYPDTQLVRENGQRAQHGRRRHYCPTHPVFRAHSRRITDVLSREFGGYDNVPVWQLDNEFGPEYSFCHCEHCQAHFRVWLQRRYGTLDALNAAWATRFWSMDFTDWGQVRLGQHDFYSATLLDSRRFWSDSFVDFAREQAEIIRRNDPGVLVTTNGMGPLFDPINYYDLFRDLDVAPDDLYFDIATMDADVAAMNIYRNYKPGKAFWINETGSGALSADKVPTPGQLRAWAFSALAHGCEAYTIFRWRTCLSGQEQELQGVLEYSGKPRRRYAAVKALFTELETLWPRFADAPLPRAEVAMLNDYDTLWGYLSSRINVNVEYPKTFYAVHKCFFDRNVGVDVIPPDRALDGYKLVVLPSLMIVGDDLAARLRAFVAGGGTVLALPQLACRDANDNYLPANAPAGLTDLFGLRVETGTYLTNYTGPDQALWVPGPNFAKETPAVRVALPAGPVTGTTRGWMEDVELEGGTALGTFTDNDYAGCPFYVQHATGRGATLYAAAYPEPPLLAALVDHALGVAAVAPGPDTPPWVEVLTRGDYTFVINHTADPVDVPLPAGDALVGTYADGAARLQGHDVCVVAHA